MTTAYHAIEENTFSVSFFFFSPCLCRLLHLNNTISFLHSLQNYSQLAPLDNTVILNGINDFNMFRELKYSYKNSCAETALLCLMHCVFVQTKVNLIFFYFKVLTQLKGRWKEGLSDIQ